MKETKFKQTEVGMIPSDWEVKTLGSVYRFKYGIFNNNPDNGGPFPVYGANGIIGSYTKYNAENSVVIGHIGTAGTVIWAEGKHFVTYNGTIADIKDKSANDSRYGYFQLLRLDIPSICNGSSQPFLAYDKLNVLNIPLPPTIEEQQRIANALSDVDTLIANLEKLIAKKKNIKQGAMQQLLTGRKRLPGFGSDERQKECHSERSAKREVEESSGYKMTELGLIPNDWEVKPIKELGLFLGGGTPSTKNESFWKGNIPWISSADLNDDDIEHISMTRFITQEAVNFSATQICPQGTILIIARVGVGKLALSQQKVCTSQDFCNLIPSKENDSKFLAYALLPVMKRMSNESQGTSIKGVAADEIKKVQIIVPSSKAEQTAIANVLSDMDTEISALETKLAKYRTLKTGMMQQLLTGKIRLV
ncbi:MAG: restriction endonuclease subunit S [Fibrobacter sp.]|nr:restriction endonuclease subunit S [Fibrobacter sp.]MBR6125955.1 restriction endonuclease subunit S [Candidatus Saccharibacteria bacterium]